MKRTFKQWLMLYNSTIINQTNNRLPPSHTQKTETTTYDVEIQVLAWDMHKKVAVLNRLLEFQSSLLDKWISNGNTYINKVNI